jgi:hypothetical protein
MPGTVIFKPIQANLSHEREFFVKMEPYCTFILGHQEAKGEICKEGGDKPCWNDTIALRRRYEPYCLIEIRDKGWLRTDEVIGKVEIDLQEIESERRVAKWYKVIHNNQPAGEIFIEALFVPENYGSYKETVPQQEYSKQTYTQSIYPAGIYSPAKQSVFDNFKQISQIPVQEIPGLDIVHQYTFSHISHHLTPEEYHKLHSRQDERYQPAKPVVRPQEKPPSWPGYETTTPIELQQAPRTPEKQKSSTNSTKFNTPDNGRTAANFTEDPASECINYYPYLGGVTYIPEKGGWSYRPFYEKTSYYQPEVKQKACENLEVGDFSSNIDQTSIQTKEDQTI